LGANKATKLATSKYRSRLISTMVITLIGDEWEDTVLKEGMQNLCPKSSLIAKKRLCKFKGKKKVDELKTSSFN
jgi:hypothetical protein